MLMVLIKNRKYVRFQIIVCVLMIFYLFLCLIVANIIILICLLIVDIMVGRAHAPLYSSVDFGSEITS